MTRFAWYGCFACCCCISCKKPYAPTLVSLPSNYLVVEGTINSGADSTVIRLSRTFALSGNKPKPETKAIVTIENDLSEGHLLTETAKGTYVIGPLSLDNTHKYRLRIKTTDNKEYVSDLQIVQYNPPIDSVGFNVTKTGIDVYVNTHDPKNNTHYYRWDYGETWMFHSYFTSAFVSDGYGIGERKDQVHTCFTSDSSSTIVIGTSGKLEQDVIYQNVITKIPSTSEKLDSKYSIYVRQYVLTKEGFEFWSQVKKVTEQLGGIFDAQPSEIGGNIHNIKDPKEPVIGYINVSNSRSKRIYITKEQLPSYFEVTYPYTCRLDSTLFKNRQTGNDDVFTLLVQKPESGIPTTPILENSAKIGYFRTSDVCGDCTIRGTVKQPVFWK